MNELRVPPLQEFKVGDRHEQVLLWMPELGIGYVPEADDGKFEYGKEYFEEYERRADTEMGKKITEARWDFCGEDVLRDGEVLVDFGCGSGQFLAHRPDLLGKKTFGYDVNPYSLRWLYERDAQLNPFGGVDVLTAWDALEHEPYLATLLAQVRRRVVTSVPIFENMEHVLKSKHFKKGEHLWYFTRDGLIEFFRMRGFALETESYFETRLGRDGIGSFSFLRTKP